MRQLVLGVIGHVDHGKTALVRALTGVDTDRLAEEKRRGISVALGFAYLEVGDTNVDLIDMPGHERFVRTMICGAAGIDAVLLVVAANEGIQPQTREHVDIAALLGLRRAVVAISKVDRVAPQEALQVAEAAVDLLTRSGLEPLPPVMTSALQGQGIEPLRHAFAALAAQVCVRAADGLTFLPIDRAFSVRGHGPVVTGTLRGAAVTAAEPLELLPLRRTVRVRAIEVHGVRVAQAAPGQRVALNLRDIDSAELERGMVLAAPDTLALSEWLTISLRAVPGAPPLKSGMTLRALLGSNELDVRLRLLDRDRLEGDERGFAQLHCATPVALPAGEHVILRLPSPPRTLAGGRILEPEAQRRRRHCPRTLQRLEDLRSLPPAQMLAAELERAGPAGSTLKQLSQLCALGMPRLIELLGAQPSLITRSGTVVHREAMDALRTRIGALLREHAAGLSREQLLCALAGTGAAVLDAALESLQAGGRIGQSGGRFLIPRPQEDRARARNESELAARIAETLRRGGLTPPNVSAIVTDLPAKRALDRLLREGVVVCARDRAKGKEILFHQDAIEDAQRRLAPLLARAPGLRVTEVGAALGISRKFSMPLLDHLDAIRFTRRIKDRRVRAG